MLGTPKAPAQALRATQPPQDSLWAEEIGGRNRSSGKGKRNYGRLARGHEYSPGFAISGRESGHTLQVRRRTEDPRVQTGQSLALQEIAAGSVDGREVE